MTRAALGRAGRLIAIALCALSSGALSSGCGPSLYTFSVLGASSSVHQAEQAGAAEWSPYEYWTAHEYLEKAAEEANEGNYDDATRFVQRAREMGDLAQAQTRDRRRAETERAVQRGPAEPVDAEAPRPESPRAEAER